MEIKEIGILIGIGLVAAIFILKYVFGRKRNVSEIEEGEIDNPPSNDLGIYDNSFQISLKDKDLLISDNGEVYTFHMVLSMKCILWDSTYLHISRTINSEPNMIYVSTKKEKNPKIVVEFKSTISELYDNTCRVFSFVDVELQKAVDIEEDERTKVDDVTKISDELKKKHNIV